MSLRTLFADRPVGNDDDPIWSEPKGRDKADAYRDLGSAVGQARAAQPIRRHLEQIADTFVAPLAGGKPMPSLTVAVSGPWGSGKSSALRVLRDLAIAKVRALGLDGAASDLKPQRAPAPPDAAGEPASDEAVKVWSERLVCCEYAAPVWEATKLDARTSLVARMVASLAGGDEKAVEDLFLAAKGASVKVSDAAQPRDAEGRAAWNALALEQISAGLSRLQDFDALLRKRILGEPGKARVLVVLVDDLDRCDPSFVYEVLSELQQLGNVENLFFVVAADEAMLRRAVREGERDHARTEIEAGNELAKLIQYTVAVPPLDEEGTSRLLRRLFEGAEDDPLAKALIANARLVWSGLPERTPRAVKRCLNALGYALRGALERPDLTPVAVQRIIKRALLAHTWQEFHDRYFEPMSTSRGARDREALFRLQSVPQRFSDEGDHRLRHEIRFLCAEYPLLEWQDLPLELLRFLGESPLLVELSTQAPDMPGTRNGSGLLGPPILPPELSAQSAGALDAEALLNAALDEMALLQRDRRTQIERAARVVTDLQRFEPASDGAAMSIARAVLPELAKSPGSGDVLAALLDRYVVLLRGHGLHRMAGRALHDAYVAARQVAYVRDAYSMYLMGAGAMEAARKVSASDPTVSYRELFCDEADEKAAFACSDTALQVVELIAQP